MTPTPPNLAQSMAEEIAREIVGSILGPNMTPAQMTEIIQRRIEPLERQAEKARAAVEVWNRQKGRVFESMGGDNPRANAIDEALTNLKEALSKL